MHASAAPAGYRVLYIARGSKGYSVLDLFARVSGACWVSRLVPQSGYVGPEGGQCAGSKTSGSRARHRVLIRAEVLGNQRLGLRVEGFTPTGRMGGRFGLVGSGLWGYARSMVEGLGFRIKKISGMVAARRGDSRCQKHKCLHLRNSNTRDSTSETHVPPPQKQKHTCFHLRNTRPYKDIISSVIPLAS